MQYKSTRDNTITTTAAGAIVTGLAPNGGLFVPTSIPTLAFETLQGKTYEEIALAVLRCFLPEYSDAFLADALAKSYGQNFQGKAGHLAALEDNLFSLELWHGPTAAFKDYALQLMPRLLVEAKQLLNHEEKTMILVATSGDTGKAALEGYKNIPGIQIAVFYPNAGTSEIQRLQMATQDGDNVAVYGVEGNFDDAQRGVKIAFSDKGLADKLAQRGIKLSSANSINWGRLVPQIVYYATSYLAICAKGTIQYGDKVDYCIPTGNFGDIMAGYYAKQMGLPIGKLICASNQNNVLTDFIATGCYDTGREFHKTSSPSMDILVSSNLERLLCHESGDEKMVAGWMENLAKEGKYTIAPSLTAAIQETFAAGYANETEVAEEIQSLYHKYHYLSDPHTAVAFHVLAKTKRDTTRPAVVLSTASPFKFSGKVLDSLGQSVPEDEFDTLRALEDFSGEKAPDSLANLQGKQVRFTDIIARDSIPEIPLSL